MDGKRERPMECCGGFCEQADPDAGAERIVTLDRQAAAEGRGSFAIDGKMIDIPVVQRAAALLERANAITARTRSAPNPG